MEVNRPRPKQCVIQKISIPPPPPMKGIFCKTPPLWKFRLIFIHFLIFFGLTDPPGDSNPLCGGVSIFSGTAQLSDGAVVQFECDYNNNNNDNDNDNNRDFAC